MEVVASLFQGRTAAAQCGLFTHKSVPVIFEPPCISPFFNSVSTSFTKEIGVILSIFVESAAVN